MKTKYVIVGGGVAGLCAAIRLSELGEQPLLIEGGTYPTHKVCGEFLSPECIQTLRTWNIHPTSIPKLTLRTDTTCLNFSFPLAAGGLSHMQLDPALAKHAETIGAQIKTQTQVLSFEPKKQSEGMHLIQLSNGESIEAAHAIFATGRIPSYSHTVPKMTYMGFKAHFKGIFSSGDLDMYSMDGAYLGVAPVENDIYNVACLAAIKKVNEYINPQTFMATLISQNPFLDECLSQGKNLFDQWMISSLPAFGIKQTPEWLDTYFIGDAAVSIPPACGNGLSMGILGGRLAAEYALRYQARDFKIFWKKRCTFQMFFAKILHKLMLNPTYGNPFINLANYFPYLSKIIFELTRQSK